MRPVRPTGPKVGIRGLIRESVLDYRFDQSHLIFPICPVCCPHTRSLQSARASAGIGVRRTLMREMRCGRHCKIRGYRR
ncbi:hypothetical protein THER5_1806 [Bifidobacterium thermacidophilum subsp. thermacidophilum]|uniref:Uncharacterized protein n=1 Tax=Bifidobacterium thermacidophilum subsp. thermacidophilum TaxID=79262 RepID=A0A087E8Y5_9BIFI|nr:hypothetical protein THER5_1806 [Bifidobacterium thermacidophilum subsp. thermacidophilum]